MGGELVVHRLQQILVDRAAKGGFHGAAQRAFDHRGCLGQSDNKQSVKGALAFHVVQLLGDEPGKLRFFQFVEIVPRGERMMRRCIAMERGSGRIRTQIA